MGASRGDGMEDGGSIMWDKRKRNSCREKLEMLEHVCYWLVNCEMGTFALTRRERGRRETTCIEDNWEMTKGE